MTTDSDLIFAELGALRALMGAMIITHPNKPALQAAFDAMISLTQVQIAADGGAPLHQLAREKLEAYRSLLVQHDGTDN